MNTSPAIELLATALHKAQGVLSSAKKDATNPHFKSRYADLASVWEAARPALQANGLSVAQTFTPSDGDSVTVETLLLHTSGQWISSALTFKPTKPDPQGIGSAITYGRRYGLSSILGIVADDDDDANSASVPAAVHTKAAQQRIESAPIKPITQETKAAILKLTEEPTLLAKLDDAMKTRKIASLSDLSEDVAQKILKWLPAA